MKFLNLQKSAVYLSCLVVGSLSTLAFAPCGLFFILPFTLCFLFSKWHNSSCRIAALCGLFFGLGFFGFGVSWIYISIHYFGDNNLVISTIITTLFITALALFPCFQGWFIAKFFRKKNISKLLVAIPSSWALLEWIRNWLFTGFPWLYLGYSQTNSPLSGYLPIIGIYGASFVVALSASLLLAILINRGKIRYILLLSLICLWTLGCIFKKIEWTQNLGKPINISIIQGNIPQNKKWQQQQIVPTLQLYQYLTKQHWRSDIILWPEAAVPLPLKYTRAYIQHLDKQAKKHRTTIILGIPVEAYNTRFYNAAIAIGNGNGKYFKRHLVPFGEYTPFSNLLKNFTSLLHIPMSNLMAGLNNHPNYLLADHVITATYICYEIAFTELVLKDLPKAQILIGISDDAWFGHSFAAAQHLQIAQTRALETGRYIAFATNNGISALIGPHGKIIQRLSRFKTAVLSVKAYAMHGSTPWIICGTTPIIFIFILLLLKSLQNQYLTDED